MSFKSISLALAVAVTSSSFAGVAVPVHQTFVCAGTLVSAPGTMATGFTTITVGVDLGRSSEPSTVSRFSASSVGGGLNASTAGIQGLSNEPRPAFDLRSGGQFYINRQHWSKPPAWELISISAMAAGSTYPWNLQWQTAAGNVFNLACNRHSY